MPALYTREGAPAGGSGTALNPFGTLAELKTHLNANYSGRIGADGKAGDLTCFFRGTFTEQLNISNIHGNAGAPFTLKNEDGFTCKIDGTSTLPAGQQVKHNYYSLTRNIPNGSSAGILGKSTILKYSALLQINDCENVIIDGIEICNSMGMGTSCDKKTTLQNCHIHHCVLQSAVGNFDLINNVLEYTTMINYRNQFLKSWPGGINVNGTNGAAGSNVTSPTITWRMNPIIRGNIVRNLGSEGFNLYSTDGALVEDNIISGCSGKIYVHNSRNGIIQRNILWEEPGIGWDGDYQPHAATTEADLAIPGFPTLDLQYVFEPPNDGKTYYPLGPRTGGTGFNQSAVVVGSEYAQTRAGENITIINNVFANGNGIREFWANSTKFPTVDPTIANPGSTLPWWSPTAKSNINLRIAHNTFVNSDVGAGIELQSAFAHTNGRIENNVFSQKVGQESQGFPSSQFVKAGNKYRLSPGAAYLGATDSVVTQLVKGGTNPLADTYFELQNGSPAIASVPRLAYSLTDFNGVSRTDPTAAGAVEFVVATQPPPDEITETERRYSEAWALMLEGVTLDTPIALAEWSMSTTETGANMATVSGNLFSSGGTSSTLSALIDGNDTTHMLSTGRIKVGYKFATAIDIGWMKIRMPQSSLTTHQAPRRALLACYDDVYNVWIQMASVDLTGVARGDLITIPFNNRMAGRRGARVRSHRMAITIPA